jgi:hypothetical protein
MLLTASQMITVPSSEGEGTAHSITSWKCGVFMLETFSQTITFKTFLISLAFYRIIEPK